MTKDVSRCLHEGIDLRSGKGSSAVTKIDDPHLFRMCQGSQGSHVDGERQHFLTRPVGTEPKRLRTKEITKVVSNQVEKRMLGCSLTAVAILAAVSSVGGVHQSHGYAKITGEASFLSKKNTTSRINFCSPSISL